MTASALSSTSRDALELLERVGPEPVTETRARVEAEARFARSLRRLLADVAIEVVVDELAEVPA